MIDSTGAHSRQRGLLPVSPVALLATLVVFAGLIIVRIATDGDPSSDAPGSKSVVTHANAPNLNGMTFTDATEAAGLAEPHSLGGLYGDEAMTAGVAVADVFGTGNLDIYLTRVGRPNSLYRNNGDGTFTDVTEKAGVGGVDPRNGSHAAAFADVDADGCADLYVSPARQGRSSLFMNNCDGTFREETAARGIDVTPGSTDFGAQEHGVTFGDFDIDGDLDLLVLQWDQGSLPPDAKASGRDGLCTAHRSASGASDSDRVAPVPTTPNRSRLYRNDGSGHFSDVTASVGLDFRGVLAFTGQFADLDGDGWPELLVTGDVCTSKVFHNDRGVFTEVTAEIGVGTDENGMGSVIVDVDDDGDMDWFVTSISHPGRETGCNTLGPTGCSGNRLYRNRGDGTFEDVTDRFGLREGWWGWGAAIEDFDNDGDMEVVQTNGMTLSPPPRGASNDPFFDPFAEDPMRFWVRAGKGFVDVADRVGLDDTEAGIGLVPFDFDRDGDLDILVARSRTTPILYRNDTPRDRGWLTVQLDDPTNPANRQGVGSKVVVRAGGERLVRRISTDGSYESQKPAEVHLGLGKGAGRVRVEVTWPGRPRAQVIDDVKGDGVLTVKRSNQ